MVMKSPATPESLLIAVMAGPVPSPFCPGALVSMVALSLPWIEVLPAASVMVAATVRVAPSAGLATLVSQWVALISVPLRVWCDQVLPPSML